MSDPADNRFWDRVLPFSVAVVVVAVLFYFVFLTPKPPPSVTTVVDVSIRSSRLNSSTGVLRLTNRTGRTLIVGMSMLNVDTNQRTSHVVTLGAFKTEEIGILEANWAFAPGETIQIYCDGYKDVKYNTFKTDRGTVGIKESWW